jgi:hypothetical protein
VFDIDERVGPKPLLQYLSRHHFARTFQQDSQDLKRLAAKFQLVSGPAQFPSPKVNFEVSERYGSNLGLFLCHRRGPRDLQTCQINFLRFDTTC